jgi:hypothetical protein
VKSDCGEFAINVVGMTNKLSPLRRDCEFTQSIVGMYQLLKLIFSQSNHQILMNFLLQDSRVPKL